MLMFKRVIIAKLFIYQISFKLINWMDARIEYTCYPTESDVELLHPSTGSSSLTVKCLYALSIK